MNTCPKSIPHKKERRTGFLIASAICLAISAIAAIIAGMWL